MPPKKFWYVGAMPAANGRVHPDVFQSVQHLAEGKPYGGYVAVFGPYSSKAEANVAAAASAAKSNPRRSSTHIPVRRNRMASSLTEAIDAAISYAEEAERYASDSGQSSVASYLYRASSALGEAAAIAEDTEEDTGEEYEENPARRRR